MQLLLLLAFSAVVVSALPSLTTQSPEWLAYKSVHGKVYKSAAEEAIRLATFAEHKSRVDQHNERFDKGLETFQLETNVYADVPHAEFVRTRNGYRGGPKVNYCDLANPTTTTTAKPTTTTTTTTVKPIGATVDWRTKGAVTPVKDQGWCGACWAFSATGALEGQSFLKTGNLVTLSEQNLLDCSSISPYLNRGCNGGWMHIAFDYVIDNKGVDTMASYPYTETQSTCAYKAANIGTTCSNYVFLPPTNETALAEAVKTIGPISVPIDASPDSFQFYKSGIYYDPICRSTYHDHAVLVVGYGTNTTTGQDYWIVKNSWGTRWGMDGYMLIARNRDNHCGIATNPVYPII